MNCLMLILWASYSRPKTGQSFLNKVQIKYSSVRCMTQSKLLHVSSGCSCSSITHQMGYWLDPWLFNPSPSPPAWMFSFYLSVPPPKQRRVCISNTPTPILSEAHLHISSPLAKARPSEFYSTSGDLDFICFDAKNVNWCPVQNHFLPCLLTNPQGQFI